jgi:Cell division protein CrgA
VPKSRVRKKAVYIPPPRSARSRVSPAWLAPTMVACLVIGLAWIAVYYITNGTVAGMSTLGDWNMVIGFVLIIAGVVLATRWR